MRWYSINMALGLIFVTHLVTGIANGQELSELPELDDSAVQITDESSSATPDWMQVVTEPIDHQLGPELCWSKQDWLRPIAPCPAWGWNAKLDMLILSRSDPGDLELQRNEATGDELLNASDLSFSGELGPRFQFVAPLGRRWELEFSIFGVDGWRSQALIPGPNLLRVPGPADGSDFLQSTSPLIDHRSQLGSQELNLRRVVNNRLTLLGGVRTIQLNESFSASTFSTVAYEVHTDNRLYGVQAGADLQLIRNRRVELFAFARAAILNNDAVAETLDVSGVFAATPANRALAAFTKETAFAAEAGLIGSIRIWEFVFLRGGYQALHVESVALAPDQLPLNDFATLLDPLQSQSGVDPTGRVFYHGAVAGLEVRW